MIAWYERGGQVFLFENALSHHLYEIEMPIPSHLVAQGPQTRNIYRIPCYLRVELVLPGLNPASRQEALDAESTKRNPSTARCCQVGARLGTGGLLGPHCCAGPCYVGGPRLPTPPALCDKEPAPLDCSKHFSLGAKQTSEAAVAVSNRRPRQQSGVPGRASDVRPENRRHGPVSFPTCLQSLQTLERPSWCTLLA